jgi:vancomycin resistance protein VanJ
MMRFRVLSANVANGLAKPERLASMIRDSGADLVGLTELSREQAEVLSHLADIYPYRALHGLGIPGKGILSHFPMHETTLTEWHPGRPDLQASVLLGKDAPLRLIVAHLPPRLTALRRAQFEAMVKAATEGIPTVLLGDFNMNGLYREYRRLAAAGLTDAFSAAGTGRGYTFPYRRGRIRLRPLVRIDFIWHTVHLKTTRAWVGSDYGSDHLPIYAELEWQYVKPSEPTSSPF